MALVKKVRMATVSIDGTVHPVKVSLENIRVSVKNVGVKVHPLKVSLENVGVKPKRVAVQVQNIGVKANPVEVVLVNIGVKPKGVEVMIKKNIVENLAKQHRHDVKEKFTGKKTINKEELNIKILKQKEERAARAQRNNWVEKETTSEHSENSTEIVTTNSTFLDTTYTLPLDSTFTLPTSTSHGMIPASQPDGGLGDPDNYGLEDFLSDDSTDDEACPRKQVPAWAKKNNLVDQSHVCPDLVFEPCVVMEDPQMFRQDRPARHASLHLDLTDIDLDDMELIYG